MDNTELIKKFYSSFSNGNFKEMTECYHDSIVFQDPVFGTLKGEQVVKMWEMLLSHRTKSTKISFNNIQSTIDSGSADWRAEYIYGEKNRKVINIINASFIFKDGKIIKHIDSFDLWKWTRQAIGPVGYLIGWTPFMRNKIQKSIKQKLNNFINKK